MTAMFKTETATLTPRVRRWCLRALGLFAGGLLVGMWVTATGCGPDAIKPQRTSGPASLAAWELQLAVTSTHGQTGTFNGRYESTESILIPALATFTLRAQADQLPLDITPESGWRANGGKLDLAGDDTEVLEGLAPARPGLYRIEWSDPHFLPARGSLKLLVLEKAEARTNDGRIKVSVGGKNIGAFLEPAQAPVARIRENAFRYAPPLYFATLDDQTLELPLGDGLDLGQLVAFIDRRDANGKKIFTTQRHTNMLPPNRALFHKLNLLRERLRQQGVKVTRFWITSGFRTPDYNKLIGGAAYSRHAYGDAADLCIDEDGDKHMDDLNGDGRLDRHDGIVIGRACAALEAEGKVASGGIGVYEWDGEDSVRSHVHVDCRGYAVRWGQAARGKQKTGFDWWSGPGVKDGEPGSEAHE